MTKRSPWSSQHESASLSGEDSPFHLKRARVPKLIETMSFDSSRAPNSGSLSLCQATRENRPDKGSDLQQLAKHPSAHQGFIRGATALHKPVSSDQHRSPVCGLIAVPCPYADEQEHAESGGTDHAVWYDPFFTQSHEARREEKNVSSPQGTPEKPKSRPICFLHQCPPQPTSNCTTTNQVRRW